MDNNQANALVIDEKALKQGSKKGWLNIKVIIRLIFLLAIGVVAFELYLGVKSLNQPNLPVVKEKPATFKNVEPVGSKVSIALLSSNNQIKVGETINVDLKLTTFGKSIKDITAVIKYDPKMMDISGGDFFTRGEVYTVNPLVTKNALKGTIRISGQTGSPSSGFAGVGLIGNLKFIAKKIGNTQLSIDPSAQVSDYLDGTNLLGDTYNLELSIK